MTLRQRVLANADSQGPDVGELESGTEFLKTVVLDDGEFPDPVVGDPDDVVEGEEGVLVGVSRFVLEHAANPATTVTINKKRTVVLIENCFRLGVTRNNAVEGTTPIVLTQTAETRDMVSSSAGNAEKVERRMSNGCAGRSQMTLEDAASVTGSTLVLQIAGALDLETLPYIGHEIMAAVGSGRAVVLDAADLSFCDSHGIGLVIAAAAKARAQGTSFAIRDLRPPIRHLFETTGLDREIELLPKTS